MKIALLIVVIAAACKPSKPAAEAPAAAESPMEQNKVEKYVGGLQADVKRAQEAKEKADAAVKKTDEAGKLPE